MGNSATLANLAKVSQSIPKIYEEILQSPSLPPTPTGPTTDLDASPPSSPYPKYSSTDEPLYTEINIPLPSLPKQKPSSVASTSRSRAHTLHSFRPWHRRSSSTDSACSKSSAGSSEAWPRIRKEVKSKDVARAMDLMKGRRRNGTIDALAVVPTVLVLSAELFTPEGEGKVKKRGEGQWEDAIV
ncbi:hypothetical protein P280DRAFT_239330 [Massarina eburnea CBS 473.64]|uniref:Uncharacterized protein n=1 Tax=Massarina eburnea CBS 473.64 TaxID=1395130 RepID=A0A6A6RHM6_9PLEO|nr:hypothetical protein P280DRAFT_239330 [Massarina eburnea CBS 473.64]